MRQLRGDKKGGLVTKRMYLIFGRRSFRSSSSFRLCILERIIRSSQCGAGAKAKEKASEHETINQNAPRQIRTGGSAKLKYVEENSLLGCRSSEVKGRSVLSLGPSALPLLSPVSLPVPFVLRKKMMTEDRGLQLLCAVPELDIVRPNSLVNS